PEETTAITWSRFHNPSEPMHCAVAELHGKVIGMVHYIEHRSCWTSGDYMYLQDLFVELPMRGRGVGRALIEHVYERAAASGASRVWWLTHESNKDANNSLHNHIKRMLASGNPAPKESDIDYKSATISGASLAHQPVEWLVTPGQLGVKEGFQLVILADGSAAPLSDARRIESRRLIREHAATIRKHGGQVALYMTHAYAAPHRQTKPQNLTATARHYIEAANEIDALVIPVALAFEEAYRQRPNVSLHMTYDGSHPNALGTYLAACVTFSSIYSQPCKGNIYNYFGQFSPEEIAFLQSVSDTVVQRFFNR
ncbi:MAG: GNAT family N-acetyltransferase, partial [Betaproteobacteria bacterium]|nr:GNAT family N-acetyltransferase [Betaproteobacteria bacterium]